METLSYMKQDLNIVITDIDSKIAYKLATFFGVENDNLPAMRIVDFKGKNNSPRKFSLSQEITSDNMLDFVEKWQGGQVYE